MTLTGGGGGMGLVGWVGSDQAGENSLHAEEL